MEIKTKFIPQPRYFSSSFQLSDQKINVLYILVRISEK